MQKNDDKIHTFGICQRIFNFVSRFVSPLMSSPFPGFAEVPVLNGGSSMDETRKPKGPYKPRKEEDANHRDQKMARDDDAGSAIEIHFKQTEENDLEYWTTIDKLSSSVHEEHDPSEFKKVSTSSVITPTKDKAQDKMEKSNITDPSPNIEPSLDKVNATSLRQGSKKANQTRRGKSFQETQQAAQRKGAQKAVDAEDKGNPTEREQISLPTQAKGPSLRMSPEDFLSASINEKSHAFLESRKQAMRRNIG